MIFLCNHKWKKIFFLITISSVHLLVSILSSHLFLFFSLLRAQEEMFSIKKFILSIFSKKGYIRAEIYIPGSICLSKYEINWIYLNAAWKIMENIIDFLNECDWNPTTIIRIKKNQRLLTNLIVLRYKAIWKTGKCLRITMY